jgi:hypothetical protein
MINRQNLQRSRVADVADLAMALRDEAALAEGLPPEPARLNYARRRQEMISGSNGFSTA